MVWVLHGSFVTAIVAYAIVGFVARNAARPPVMNPATAFPVLLVLGLTLVGLGLKIPDFLPAGSANESAREFLVRSQRSLILGDTLIEASGVLGVVAFYLHSLEDWQFAVQLVLCALGLVAMIPRVRGWIDEYEERASRET